MSGGKGMYTHESKKIVEFNNNIRTTDDSRKDIASTKRSDHFRKVFSSTPPETFAFCSSVPYTFMKYKAHMRCLYFPPEILFSTSKRLQMMQQSSGGVP